MTPAEVPGDGSLADRVRGLLDRGVLDLAPLGGGATPARWAALAALARRDVAEARLGEAHVDAVQILREAGRPAPAGRLLGVWASEGPGPPVRAEAVGPGRLRLVGSKGFCGGAGIVDGALVTVEADTGSLLVLVDLRTLGPERIDTTGWLTPALADTATAVVDLTDLEVPVDDVVGEPRWYLDRPGFWDGAIGPAACWAGAAAGLVDVALERVAGDEPHALAHLGAVRSAAWAMHAVLATAGREIDGDPGDTEARRARALAVRHLVDRHCADVQDRFARALGPRPLVADAAVIERDRALTLYRRQCHAERDLEALGRLSRRRREP